MERVISKAVDPELLPGARNAIRVCLNVQPPERVTVITDRECEEIAASLVHEIEQVGAPYHAFVLEDVAAAAADRTAGRHRRRHGTQPGQHLRRARAGQRARLAHGDDRHRQSPPHAPRAHGQHQPPDHARRHARRLSQGRSAQRQGARDRCAGAREVRATTPAGSDIPRRRSTRTTAGSRRAA